MTRYAEIIAGALVALATLAFFLRYLVGKFLPDTRLDEFLKGIRIPKVRSLFTSTRINLGFITRRPAWLKGSSKGITIAALCVSLIASAWIMLAFKKLIWPVTIGWTALALIALIWWWLKIRPMQKRAEEDADDRLIQRLNQTHQSPLSQTTTTIAAPPSPTGASAATTGGNGTSTPPPPAGGNGGTPPTPPSGDGDRRGTRKRTNAFIALGLTIYILTLTYAVYTESWRVAVPLVTLAFSFFALMFIAWSGASHNMWLCYVRDGTLRTVVAGPHGPNQGKYVRFILNVKGHYFDKEDRKIKKAFHGEDRCNWFTELTGLYFVSWLWPIRHIYSFNIKKVRITEKNRDAKSLAEKIEVDEKVTPVDELLFTIKRPFYLREVDLLEDRGVGDTRIDILAEGIFILWDPYTLLFTLSGYFFDNLDSLIEGYIVAKLKALGFKDLTDPKSDIDPLDLKGSDDPDRVQFKKFDVMNIIGLITESLVVKEFSLSASAIRIQNALEDQRIAQAQAQAAIDKSKGDAQVRINLAEADRQVKILEAQGKAEAIERLADARKKEVSAIITGMTEHNVSPNLAATVYRDDLKFPNLKGLRVYAEAGSEATLLLQDVVDARKEPEDTEEEAVPVGADSSDIQPEAQIPPQNQSPRKRKKGRT